MVLEDCVSETCNSKHQTIDIQKPGSSSLLPPSKGKKKGKEHILGISGIIHAVSAADKDLLFVVHFSFLQCIDQSIIRVKGWCSHDVSHDLFIL